MARKVESKEEIGDVQSKENGDQSNSVSSRVGQVDKVLDIESEENERVRKFNGPEDSDLDTDEVAGKQSPRSTGINSSLSALPADASNNLVIKLRKRQDPPDRTKGTRVRKLELDAELNSIKTRIVIGILLIFVAVSSVVWFLTNRSEPATITSRISEALPRTYLDHTDKIAGSAILGQWQVVSFDNMMRSLRSVREVSGGLEFATDQKMGLCLDALCKAMPMVCEVTENEFFLNGTRVPIRHASRNVVTEGVVYIFDMPGGQYYATDVSNKNESVFLIESKPGQSLIWFRATDNGRAIMRKSMWVTYSNTDDSNKFTFPK